MASHLAMLLALALAIFLGKISAEEPMDVYDDYYDGYYPEAYEEAGEVPYSTMPTSNLSLPDLQVPREFRGSVACTSSHIVLEVDRDLLPSGLSFDKRSYHETASRRSDRVEESCVRITNNATHIIYSVALDCQRAVGRLIFGSVVVYSHEALMIGGGSYYERGYYTVVMECETVTTRNRKGVDPHSWMPELRLFEHRVGAQCVQTECPHGEFCLPEEDLDGYICSCPVNAENCGCPQDFYGCRHQENVTTTSTICIRNERLCNKRFDCPLKDDELCADVWASWTAWSLCNTACGKGLQFRRRACKHTFIDDPKRCSKRCNSGLQSDSAREERSCDSGPCTSVLCESESMTITVPVLSGELLGDRLHLKDGGGDECRPILNSTHAKFVIPLHKCNTTTWIDGDLVFYSNEVIYEVDKEPSSMIIREYGHSYLAKCQYKRRHTVGLRRLEPNSGSELLDIPILAFIDDNRALRSHPGRLDVKEHHTSGDGEFEFRMDIFTDSSYAHKYLRKDYPLQKRLGERLYAAVTFSSQDEDLHVFIERCWATASDENGISRNDTKYQFISGGCPVDPTVFFHNHDNSHFSDRYSIESFKFDDPDHWYVYFLCEVVICEVDEDDNTCRRECGLAREPAMNAENQGGRKKREAREHFPTYAHVMQGPVMILSEESLKSPIRRSEGSVGTVQHKILNFDVQGEVDVHARSSDSFEWTSPFVYAAVAGIVCMVLGVAIGSALSRRKSTRRHI